MASLSQDSATQRLDELMNETEKQGALLVADIITEKLGKREVNMMAFMRLQWGAVGAVAMLFLLQGIKWFEKPAYIEALSGTEFEQLIGTINACNKNETQPGAIKNCKVQAKGFLISLDSLNKTVAMAIE
ncbi:MAG: hypothetical protein AAGI66_07360 [Cyanobacteria bacterium P01_H01_bin.74]